MAIATEGAPSIGSAARGVLESSRTSLRLLARNRMGFVGFVVVVAIVLISYLGPLFVTPDTGSHTQSIYLGPSLQHPLGTDSQGKDVLRQIVTGGADILTVGFLAAFLSTAIAVTLGSLGALLRGRIDFVVTSLADMVLTIPPLPLLAVLAGILKLNGSLAVAGVIGLLFWPTLMRAIRSQVLSLKEREYVEAARALDLSTSHIVFREIAPNMGGFIAINFTLAVTKSMYASVALILLGLVPLSGNNWGAMINLAWTRGAIFFEGSLLSIMAPIAMIAIFQLGMVALNRSLTEIFDPRLRRTN